MSTQQQIQPETLQGKDLANVARATWRQVKSQIGTDPQMKQKLDELINELSFRVENNAQTHQQAMSGQPYQPQQAQQGQVQPVATSGQFGGSSGGSY